MTNRSRTTLVLLVFSACAGGLNKNPAEDTSDGDPSSPSQTNSTGPTASTPFEGTIIVGGPGQYQDGGSAGVGFGLGLHQSVPGGSSCYWGSRLGNCCYTVHRSNDNLRQSNAGVLRITNLTDPGPEPSLYTYLDPGGEYVINGNFPRWHLGDTLSVSASGDEIHAFSATVAVPPGLTGLPPEFVDVPDSGATLHVSLAEDWSIRWTPAGASFVRLTLWTHDSGEVECTARDTDGQIVVPQQILNKLSHSNDTGSAYITRVMSTIINGDNLMAEFDAELSDLSAKIQF